MKYRKKPVIVDAEHLCSDCKAPIRFYLKRRKWPWSAETEKVCFNCATGGVFKKPRKPDIFEQTYERTD